MIKKLLNIIQMVVDLLTDCGWEDKAKWFSTLKSSFENTDQTSNEFNNYLNELDKVLSGMGSFSDLPLKDKSGRMSDQEVRDKQWELVELLGDAIEELRG